MEGGEEGVRRDYKDVRRGARKVYIELSSYSVLGRVSGRRGRLGKVE